MLSVHTLVNKKSNDGVYYQLKRNSFYENAYSESVILFCNIYVSNATNS